MPVVKMGRRVVTIGVVVVTARRVLSGSWVVVWSIVLPRPGRFSSEWRWVGGVRSGFDLMNCSGGGAVEHVIFTLFGRMALRVENWTMWAGRTVQGGVTGASAQRTLDCLSELHFFWSWEGCL